MLHENVKESLMWDCWNV